MGKFCSCGSPIEQARLDATKGQAKTCIKCMHSNDVSRKAGYMPSESKMRGQIIIGDQDTIMELHQKAWRAGTGVSRGVKFHTGRK